MRICLKYRILHVCLAPIYNTYPTLPYTRTRRINLKELISNLTRCQHSYRSEYYNTTTGHAVITGTVSSPLDACVSILDLRTVHPQAVGFKKGFANTPYAYLVPGENSVAVRVSVSNFTLSEVSIVDLAGYNPSLGGYSGGFADGQWACFR